MYHPSPLMGHILILLSQGRQQPQLESEDRDMSGPKARSQPLPPSVVPTDCGRRQLWCSSRSVKRRKMGPCINMAKRFLLTTSQRRGDWNCPSPVRT